MFVGEKMFVREHSSTSTRDVGVVRAAFNDSHSTRLLPVRHECSPLCPVPEGKPRRERRKQKTLVFDSMQGNPCGRVTEKSTPSRGTRRHVPHCRRTKVHCFVTSFLEPRRQSKRNVAEQEPMEISSVTEGVQRRQQRAIWVDTTVFQK
jgi:hypothetical protein